MLFTPAGYSCGIFHVPGELLRTCTVFSIALIVSTSPTQIMSNSAHTLVCEQCKPSPPPLGRFDMGDSAPQVSGVKVYQSESSGADEVIMELDFGWTSDAEMSMVVHPMPHSAWLATPVIEILSKLIVVKVGSAMDLSKKCVQQLTPGQLHKG